MTIMEALQWANNKLHKVGIDSPMLDAEILLANAIGTPKAWLFAHFSDNLKAHQLERFHILIDRRAAREPVAYLVGKKSFYGRDFVVNPSVLIPRPETETLIEEALTILKDADVEHTLISDIGTGSGAIAVTLAAETKLPVIAIDIDEQTLKVAKQNAINAGVQELIDFQCGNIAEPLVRIFKTIRKQTTIKTSSVYPFKHLLITANLPYLPESRMETVEPEVRDFEPRGALVAGADGMDAYFELFRQLRSNRKTLPRALTVLIEIDPNQKNLALDLICHNFPNAKPAIKQDLHGDDRVIIVEI
jgi:release factor glutamine methyltransferase